MIRALIILLITFPNILFAQWKQVPSNTKTDIHDIRFVTEKTGYAAADNAILKTSDGGDNWQEIVTHKALVNLTDLVVTEDSIFGFGTNAKDIPYKLSLHKKGGRYSIVTIPHRIRSPQYLDGEIYYLDNRKLLKYHGGKPEALLSDVDDFKLDSDTLLAITPSEMFVSADKGANWTSEKLQMESLQNAPVNTYFAQLGHSYVAVRYLFGNSNSRESDAVQKQYLAPSHFYYFISGDNKKSGKEVLFSIDSGVTFGSTSFTKRIIGCSSYGEKMVFLSGEKGKIFKLQDMGLDLQEDGKIEVIGFKDQRTMGVQIPGSFMRHIKIYDDEDNLLRKRPSGYSKIALGGLPDGSYKFEAMFNDGTTIKSTFILKNGEIWDVRTENNQIRSQY